MLDEQKMVSEWGEFNFFNIEVYIYKGENESYR